MTNHPEIQWKLRFLNYKKALKELKEAEKIVTAFLFAGENSRQEKEDTMFRFMQQGLMVHFNTAFETAWKVMKDYSTSDEATDGRTAEEAIRKAYLMELISSEKTWKEMLVITKRTSGMEKENIYPLVSGIIVDYIPVLNEFQEQMQKHIDIIEE